MKLLSKISLIIIVILSVGSCSSNIISLDNKRINDISFAHFCGAYDDEGKFYKTGFKLGEIPLYIDFTKIEVDKLSDTVNLVGYIRDYHTGEEIPGELIVANIAYQDSFKIYYNAKLIREVNYTGSFNILTEYNPNNIIIVKLLGYKVTYYDLSELMNVCYHCDLNNVFSLYLWKIDESEILTPTKSDSIKFGKFTDISKPQIDSWEIFIPTSDTLRISVYNKEGDLIGAPYSSKLEKGYYNIKPNDWHLLKDNGVYFLRYSFKSVNSFSKFLYVN